MASCAQYERASRSAPSHGSGTKRVRGTAICSAGDLPDLGQRTPGGSRSDAAARSSGGPTSRSTDRVAAPRPAGQRAPRPRPNVAGRRPNRQTRCTLLGEVGVRSARPIRDAGGRRTVHGHALPPVRGATGVSISPPDGPERLRPAATDPSSSARTHAKRRGPTHWCGREGCRLPMGVQKENPITCLLGADPSVGTQACWRCIATVERWLSVVLTATWTPLDVSPEDADRLKPPAFGLARE
jgi:hypothetical protein